jgi:hypothetical protein
LINSFAIGLDYSLLIFDAYGFGDCSVTFASSFFNTFYSFASSFYSSYFKSAAFFYSSAFSAASFAFFFLKSYLSRSALTSSTADV